MSARHSCNGMGCYPQRCPPGECVLSDAPKAAGATPAPEGMFDLERDRPGLMAVLYAAAFVGAMLASHFWPWGVAS